jgi:hypothetical protein
MKTRLLMIIVSISIMAMIGIVVFGLAILTFNFDKPLDSEIPSKIQKYVFSSDIEKLLIQNQIEFSDKLVVTGGPAYEGDPGCGAVMDVNSQTHWFKIDSISEPRKMTLYSENPMPCKINHASCFCNAQTAFTEVMLTELSYLTLDEEQEIGQRIKTYLETIPHQIPVTKFVVGKYNLDLGEQYHEICGILLTKGDREDRFNEDYSVYKYFSAAKEGYNVWDFSLSVGSEKLCAIPADATIFEYEK